MQICTSERLALRLFRIDDAAFILELVNEPSWIRFIGDRGIRTLEAAREFLAKGPLAMQERLGFSFYAVERKEDGALIGMCGLVKRDDLEAVDIGYAFLPRYWGQGYALEAAQAVVRHARDVLGLPQLLAITSPDNTRSIRVLEGLGMHFRERIAYGTPARDTCVYGCRLDGAPD